MITLNTARPLDTFSPQRNTDEFPGLRWLRPCNQDTVSADGTTINEDITGAVYTRPTGLFVTDADGSISCPGTENWANTDAGSALDLNNKSALLFGVMDLASAGGVSQSFRIGQTGLGPGIGSSGSDIYIVDPVAEYRGTFASYPPLDASYGEIIAFGFAYQEGGAKKAEMMIVGASTARTFSGAADNSAGAMAASWQIPLDHQIRLPNRGTKLYGAGLLVFDSDTIPDWKDAVEWMLHDWKPKADGTPGEKRLYPVWSGKS